MIVIKFIFIGSFFLLFWYYGGYMLFLYGLNLVLRRKERGRPVPEDLAACPFFSLIIPTYNENKYILDKIRNSLSLEYPANKLEILIVDSASQDKTVELAEKFIENLPGPQKFQVVLCQQPERKGKGAAVNYAIAQAKGEVMLITDANCLLNRKALRFLAPHYRNPNVSAVGGRFQVFERGEKFDGQNKAYWLWEEKMRILESRLDSVICMSGEIGSFRKMTVPYDENSTAEDFELSLHLREKGGRVAYEPRALALEEVPRTGPALNIQKKKSVIGTITSLLKHRRLLLNPAFGWYGLLIVPSHKVLQILSPWLVIVFLLSAEGLMFHLAGPILSLGLNGLILVMFLFGRRFLRRARLFALLEFWILSQWITLGGWIDFFRGKYSVAWEKVRD